MPKAWRARFAAMLADADAATERDAEARGVPVGVARDRYAREVLEQARTTGANPSPATVAAYRRDHARLLSEGLTPQDKASSWQHFNRLRSAVRFVEAETIAHLRQQAEAARKAKQPEAMRELTRQAFERAAVFHALFLSPDRPTWGRKADALRAAGLRPVNKSKRRAGRNVPAPDVLLARLAEQEKRAPRVEAFAAVFALFGIRPKELQHGVRVEILPDGALRLFVKGAKVDATRGQPERALTVSPSSALGSSHAVALLTQAAAKTGGKLQANAADVVAVRRAMRGIQPGLSPYAYRHARASDAKATQDRAGVAAWLGHANDKTQQHYGHKRSGTGAVTIQNATASRAVRATKTLPLSLAQRFAHVAARLVSVAVAATPNRTPARPRGPRLTM